MIITRKNNGTEITTNDGRFLSHVRGYVLTESTESPAILSLDVQCLSNEDYIRIVSDETKITIVGDLSGYPDEVLREEMRQRDLVW